MDAGNTVKEHTVTLGVDIGGTKLAVGAVDPSAKIIAVERRDTPSVGPDSAPVVSPVAVIDLIAEMVGSLRRKYDVSGVGIGCAGSVDAPGEVVEHSPNLGWRRVPLREMLANRIDLPIVLDNDANVAALAESHYGAGRKYSKNLVLLTIGTGIGGGIVVAGRVWRGAFGQAGELGHTIVVPDGRRCTCGRHGCWEQYASGTTLERYYAEEGGDVSRLLQAARDDEPAAVRAFDRLGWWLGLGIANLVTAWDPALVILGGGVASAGDLLLKPTVERYREVLANGRVAEHMPGVAVADLGNEAGIIGAADLARRGR